jgi:FtsH-binding integral membrane protein
MSKSAAIVSSFIGITYLHLLAGLGVTAVSAVNPVYKSNIALIIEAVLSIALLLIVLILPPGPLKYIVFVAFSFVLGQMLSNYVKDLQDKNILIDVLATVAGIFLAMTAVGFYDNQNILGFGVYLFAALIGLVIARLAILVGVVGGAPTKALSSVNYALSWFGTILFTVYVAYDTQRLKEDARMKKKDYINSSLGLFLDAINLFRNVGDIIE